MNDGPFGKQVPPELQGFGRHGFRTVDWVVVAWNVWQLIPVKLGWQTQAYGGLTPGWVIGRQVPPFWHGLDAQLFFTCSHKTPEKLGGQTQIKLFCKGTQVAEFRQGWEAHVLAVVVVSVVVVVVTNGEISHRLPEKPFKQKQLTVPDDDWIHNPPFKQEMLEHWFGTIGILHLFFKILINQFNPVT